MSKDDVQPTRATDAPKSRPTDSDRVGYRHPPKHSRFKPGQSGNPSGRPKSRSCFGKEFVAAFLTLMPDGDKTKFRAMCDNLADAAIPDSGMALKLVPFIISIFKEDKEDGGELTAQQVQLIENFEARQELSNSPTQSHTEQSLTIQSENGDDHE